MEAHPGLEPEAHIPREQGGMRPWTEKQSPGCLPYPLVPFAEDISAGQEQLEDFCTSPTWLQSPALENGLASAGTAWNSSLTI